LRSRRKQRKRNIRQEDKWCCLEALLLPSTRLLCLCRREWECRVAPVVLVEAVSDEPKETSSSDTALLARRCRGSVLALAGALSVDPAVEDAAAAAAAN